jgi:branched-chain amino acid aminotransferase
MNPIFYINGAFVPEQEARLSVNDIALLRGYGIFDFFKAVNGVPIFIEDHLDRFEASAAKMHLAIAESREQLREAILTLIKRNPAPLLGIKIVLTGGLSPDGYTPTTPNLLMIAKPFQFADANKPMKLMLVEHQRELADIKTTNYLLPIWLLPQMKAAKADDYLYHKDGYITESSRSNIFIIKDEQLITSNQGILFGITRKHILKMAAKHFEVIERPVSLEEALSTDEVFTTGSTKRVIGIGQIDNHLIGNGQTGKATKYLQTLFAEYEKMYL